MSEHYKIDGIPSDTLTSDKVGERAYKVSLDNQEIVSSLVEALTLATLKVESQNTDIIEQLKLLNLRFEEAFDTKMNAEDI
tara:strand:- start:163 stop:405 length:243 start_codon:yes stop_codon:yes gene_type:complete